MLVELIEQAIDLLLTAEAAWHDRVSDFVHEHVLVLDSKDLFLV